MFCKRVLRQVSKFAEPFDDLQLKVKFPLSGSHGSGTYDNQTANISR
jgi:hypothetical protein